MFRKHPTAFHLSPCCTIMQSEDTQCIITHLTAQLKWAGADQETSASQTKLKQMLHLRHAPVHVWFIWLCKLFFFLVVCRMPPSAGCYCVRLHAPQPWTGSCATEIVFNWKIISNHTQHLKPFEIKLIKLLIWKLEPCVKMNCSRICRYDCVWRREAFILFYYRFKWNII